MADKIILADTSILIDYFRKTDKANSRLISLFDQGYDFNISAITHYEIYSGATSVQLPFWSSLLSRTKVLALDEIVAQAAVDINNINKLLRRECVLPIITVSPEIIVPAKGSFVRAKGRYVNAKRNFVRAKRSYVNAKGKYEPTIGSIVNAKPNNESAKANINVAKGSFNIAEPNITIDETNIGPAKAKNTLQSLVF